MQATSSPGRSCIFPKPQCADTTGSPIQRPLSLQTDRLPFIFSISLNYPVNCATDNELLPCRKPPALSLRVLYLEISPHFKANVCCLLLEQRIVRFQVHLPLRSLGLSPRTCSEPPEQKFLNHISLTLGRLHKPMGSKHQCRHLHLAFLHR